MAVLKNSRGWQITSKTASILLHWRHHDLSDARPFLPGRTWNWALVRASSGLNVQDAEELHGFGELTSGGWEFEEHVPPPKRTTMDEF